MAKESPRPTESEIQAWREARARSAIDARLSLPTPLRIALATGTSFLAGAGLGISHGAQAASLRFRAENAHRLPHSSTGWYLYHKSKNYNMAFGGLREGLKMGTKVSFWVALFFGIEYGWDECRGKKDFLNTVMGSMSVAGAFSLWNRFPITTAARMAKTGLALGLGFGLVQDAVGVMRGRRPGYVDFIFRQGRKQESKKIEVT